MLMSSHFSIFLLIESFVFRAVFNYATGSFYDVTGSSFRLHRKGKPVQFIVDKAAACPNCGAPLTKNSVHTAENG